MTKLNSSGSFVWNTFLGGSLDDSGSDITFDSSGNVYVSGSSNAAWGSPVWEHAGGYDAFVTKLNTNGDLIWNTFLGSSLDDSGSDITFDSSGSMYVSGSSNAAWGSPVRAHAGGYDAFVTKRILGPDMEISVNGNVISDNNTTPSAVDNTDFGTTDVENSTIVRTFTIENVGLDADLNLIGNPRVSISGSHASDFSVTTDPIAVLSLAPVQHFR